MNEKRCFAFPPVGVRLEELQGALIVIEGPDSSGRSTQVRGLAQWLERSGYPVAEAGLKRSKLVTPELNRAKLGNFLSPRTMSLFYATDFYDQLENRIVPALRAGYVVIADRYIYTLMARDLVRGATQDWLDSLYCMALVPDQVFFLNTSIRNQVERKLAARNELNYWESGMDLGLAPDWFDSYVKYQRKLQGVFRRLHDHFSFEFINANRSIGAIQRELRARISVMLDSSYSVTRA